MTNVPLMFQPLVKYVEFTGRSRRSEFWLWVLFRIIVGMALSTLMSGAMMSNMSTLMGNPNPDMHQFMTHYFASLCTVLPIYGLVHAALLLPSIAVGVRRLHDIGRTGWWLIMPHVVAIVGVLVFLIVFGTQIFALVGHKEQMSSEDGLRFVLQMFGSMFLFIWLPVITAWIVMLVFYVTEGKRGPNRFGPDPKGEALNDTP